ncbi:MAG: hypothetical protein K9J17_01895 [Flavobacteriales bacterium]|nr:hypothetical protein [Flavobacteriales bacterium]
MKTTYISIFFFLFGISSVFSQVAVNASMNVTQLNHGYDCGSDASGACCGCFISICNDPEPRWEVWGGHSGGSFNATAITQNPGTRSCGVWNVADYDLNDFTNITATQLNVDLRNWEEDGCGSDNNYNTGCVNNDDAYDARARVGNINFRTGSPCQFNEYGFFYNNNSYGVKVDVYWSWAAAPTFTTNITSDGSTYTVCPGVPLTFSGVTNVDNGQEVGRWFRWQSSSNGTTWNTIAGATSANYSFTTVNATASGIVTYYRLQASSGCSANWSAPYVANSATITVTVLAPSNATCNLPTCETIYVDPVNGNDGNTMRPNTPYKTVTKALSDIASNNSTLKTIKVAKGANTETQTWVMKPYTTIEGGYVPGTGNTDWYKSSAAANKTTLTFSTAAVRTENNNVKNLTAVYSNGTSNWTIQDISLVTNNATGTSVSGRGVSNYGFHIVNSSSNYTINRVNMTVGKGSNGTAGSGNANNGGNGATTGGGGGSGSNGNGNPGGGSNGTVGSAGTQPTGLTGGGGGTAGTGSDVCGSTSGGCPGSKGGCNGSNGTAGGNGAPGGAWAANNRPTAPAVSNTAFYTPGGQADSGGGGGGGGHGGGGGGSRGGRIGCVNCDGKTGGTGGDGGKGGAGGLGGFGGGGVFGMWRDNSTTGVSVTELNIAIGTAGTGGAGAAGETAPSTGRNTGKSNGSCNNCAAGQRCSGNGGNGGYGGDGGRGRDGSNGTTANTVVDGVTSSNTATIAYVPTINLNNGATRGNMPGVYCINSEISMTKNAGNWALPSGLTYVKDITSSTSSYSNTTNTAVVTTNTAGKYDITANSVVFNDFLNVAPTSLFNRTLPTVSASPSTICVGGTTTLSIANTFNPGGNSRKEQELLIYTTTPSSPTFSYSTGSVTTSAFTTAGTYIVRYRERHECCGWSRPVFATITVEEDPSAPTIAPNPNVASVCEGSIVKAVITAGSNGTGCADLYEYSTNGGADWLPYTSNSNITAPVGASVVTIRVSRSCTGNGCTPYVENSYTWSVNPLPTITFDPMPEACRSNSAQTVGLGYSATLNNPIEYTIDFNAGANTAGFIDVAYTSLTTSPIVVNVPANAGSATTQIVYNGTLSLRNGNGCVSASYPITIAINPNPTVAPTNNSPICEGPTLTLTGGGALGTTPYTYSWSGPSGYTGSGSPLDRTSSTTGMSGTYSVTLTDAKGCAATGSTVVSVVLDPTLSGQPTGTTICAGQTHSTSISVSGGTGLVYQWQYSTNGTNWFNVATNSPANGFSYSGATSPNITISTSTAVPLSDQYRFRCQVTSGTGCNPNPLNSSSITLNVVPATITASHRTWTGMVSNDWLNALNWDCGGVPDITVDVIIPAAPRYPIITTGQFAECNIIKINENGPPSTIIVEVQNGGNLKVDSP